MRQALDSAECGSATPYHVDPPRALYQKVVRDAVGVTLRASTQCWGVDIMLLGDHCC